jgi:Zn-dependent protease with chaperone function
MSDEKLTIEQMRWIIGRFIGALKAKKFRLDFLSLIIDSIEKIKIFNFFILPYERALQYTGDNIGLLICGDVEQAFIAFDKLLVGNILANRVNFEGILDQGRSIDGNFFAFLARIGSTHPPMVKRYLNLLSYARKHNPSQFRSYIEKHGDSTKLELGHFLPNY